MASWQASAANRVSSPSSDMVGSEARREVAGTIDIPVHADHVPFRPCSRENITRCSTIDKEPGSAAVGDLSLGSVSAVAPVRWGVLKAARTLHSVNAMAGAQMNVRFAVSGNQVVPPPKSRVNATVAPSVAEHRRPPSPLTVVDEALNMELDVVRRILDELMGGRCDLVIFTTGSSVWSLFVLARELGRLSDLVQVLQSMTTACRSPKAAAILRRFKVEPTLGEPGLYTSCRLIYALGRLDLAGRRAVRLNGDRGDPIANRLRAQRARLREFSLTSRRTLSKPAMSELFGLSERATGSGREPAARPSSDAKESLQWPDRARDRSRRSAPR